MRNEVERVPKINVLPKEISELIAAGEVVERPASVIKELVENSIDSGARHITVEIKRGGVSYIRVSDDGCGIEKDDVKKAFLRHSTSKIKTENDLNNILTLGFRGEALASICAVSRTEILTCSKNETVGTRYCLAGGEETAFEEAGCPTGTTIVVRDLFYNTPARMKFLKKDSYEGITAASVVHKVALSHPEIGFKLIREGKLDFSTSGNGDLKQAIFAVCGKEYHDSLIKASDEYGGIKVDGYISRPSATRPNKNGIFVFLNGRFVFSKTVAAALTKAYQNLIMVGKFPAAVLNLTVPAGTVDVNVHPAKTEVRFSDDRRIWDAVYFTAKNAIAENDQRKQVDLSAVSKHRMSVDEYRQMTMADSGKTQTTNAYAANTYAALNTAAGTYTAPNATAAPTAAAAKSVAAQAANARTADARTASIYTAGTQTDGKYTDNAHSKPQAFTAAEGHEERKTPDDYQKVMNAVGESVRAADETAKHFSLSDFAAENSEKPFWLAPETAENKTSGGSFEKPEFSREAGSSFGEAPKKVLGFGGNGQDELSGAQPEDRTEGKKFDEQINYIGEFFATYILASKGKSLYLIDKHAAHERIIFNDLTSRDIAETQMLLIPVTVSLPAPEFTAVMEYSDLLKKAGFETEEFGGDSIIVRSVPSMLSEDDVPSVIREAAESLLSKREVSTQKTDHIFHSISCRAAVKAGNVDSPEELKALAERVLSDKEIMYCPHGRPVAIELTLKEIEKQFGRIQ